MTEIERKALAIMDDVENDHLSGVKVCVYPNIPIESVRWAKYLYMWNALLLSIEQHERFRQEVSDAAEHLCKFYGVPIVMQQLERFIITKPDPLVEAVKDILNEDSLHEAEEFAEAIRAALAKRGREIREKSNG